MLIVSWNVAGLSQTAHRIHDAYHSSAPEPSCKTFCASAALQYYFKRHGADIMCLQEHKIPLSQLSSRSEPRGCSMVEGYESFWSCCVGKSQRGFNGVVTYAREGVVKSANSAPLGDEDLDAQGRCVMTDHGKFVLFNVYVPALGGQGLAVRMRFLNALRRAMRHQREVCKKPVILVGDLNIAHTARDRYWKDRIVRVHDIIEQVEHATEPLSPWKLDIAKHWPKIMSVMKTKTVASAQTTNTLTGEKFNKFRLHVTVEGRKISLGKHESSPDHCLWSYDLEESTYVDPETNESTISCENNTICISTLAELMSKIVGVVWDQDTLRLIANTHAGVNRLSPSIRWLDDVIENDGMVDTFRHFYPTAEGRFTCWHQFTNRRYENEGVRLDYILVDKVLLDQVEKGDVPSIRCCDNFQDDALGEKAALVAATANGEFKPVSFGGEGITAVSQTILDTQFGKEHTGIIYTPPSFSDHVAVSALVKESCCPRDLVFDWKDSATRKAQPHKAQKSIFSFFGAKSKASGLAIAGTDGKRTFETMCVYQAEASQNEKKKPGASFFAPRRSIENAVLGKENPAVFKRQKSGPSTEQNISHSQSKKA